LLSVRTSPCWRAAAADPRDVLLSGQVSPTGLRWLWARLVPLLAMIPSAATLFRRPVTGRTCFRLGRSD